MFRTPPIDGDLKTAVKTVKKWGFMGMKIKNVAALMGKLDNERCYTHPLATPESHTLFWITIITEVQSNGDDSWAEYQNINHAVAAQYGEPTEIISQWESPYSVHNNPMQAFRRGQSHL